MFVVSYITCFGKFYFNAEKPAEFESLNNATRYHTEQAARDAFENVNKTDWIVKSENYLIERV